MLDSDSMRWIAAGSPHDEAADDGNPAHDPGRGPDDLDPSAMARVETTSDVASAAIPRADSAGDDPVALPVAIDDSYDDQAAASQADAADTEEDAGATRMRPSQCASLRRWRSLLPHMLSLHGRRQIGVMRAESSARSRLHEGFPIHCW